VVEWDGVQSKVNSVYTGVPQGSILGRKITISLPLSTCLRIPETPIMLPILLIDVYGNHIVPQIGVGYSQGIYMYPIK